MLAGAEEHVERAHRGAANLTVRRAADFLETLGRSDALERGEVLLVSLEPIRLGLGRKWAARRSTVLEHAEKQFEKQLGPAALWMVVSDTDAMIAAPGLGAAALQGMCFLALKEVLGHFLGQLDVTAVRVGRVVTVSPDGVETAPLGLRELQAAESRLAPRSAPKAGPSALHELKSWPMRTLEGRDVAVSFAVDPIISLDGMRLAGHRIEARLLDQTTRAELPSAERRRLLPADLARIDEAALERGMNRLHESARGGPSLILQLSFVGLSNGRVRQRLLERAATIQAQLRQAAVCELVDVEAGVPAARLAEVASFVRPFFCAVFAQFEPCARAIDTVRAARLRGMTIRAADFGQTDVQIAEGMRRFAPRAMGSAAALTVTSLPHTGLILDAMASGFTHAHGAVGRRRTGAGARSGLACAYGDRPRAPQGLEASFQDGDAPPSPDGGLRVQ